ncbi:unnamed protein product [Caenorhabditis auriculariae]|uniref:C-type LECtin n=1 Tax=Caenorhabditis auriculariae TaxID=2777116 RepID=A0A8S1HPJ7_9PELO|nr:unnamed protein product [Caenorhabditis auriculariae]
MRIAFAAVAFVLFALPQAQGDLCPKGWTFSNTTSNCYLFSPNAYTFSDAESFCESQGGTLSSVRTSYELTVLANVSSNSLMQPWVGVQYNGSQWVNLDGTSFFSFYWASGQPKMNTCAALKTVKNDLGLVSIPCYSVQPVLCKQLASVCNGGNYGGFRVRNGTVNSPNYPNYYYNNLDCYYSIQGPNNSYLSITFDPYFVEDTFDYVKIYEGFSNNTANLIGTINHMNGTKKTFETFSNQMLLYFHTDTTAVRAGWQAKWTSWSLLPSINQTGDGGTLTSVNYPSNYNPLSEQAYFISTFPGFKIRAVISAFNTESNYDYLQVFASNSFAPSTLVASLNGTSVAPWSYVSPSNFLTLRFITDGSIEYTGWKLDWAVVES